MINSLVVVNPTSGKIEIKNHLFDLLSLLSSSGRKTEVLFLNGENKIEDYLEEKNEVITCGGDGTLNSVINAIIKKGKESEIKVGYIPCGSTNDFARGVGIPFDLKEASEAIVNGKEKRIDVGMWNGERAFSYVASFGVFSSVSYSTPQDLKNTFGHFAYIMNGLLDVCNIKSFPLKVESENGVIKGDYCFGAVLNSTSLAGIVKFDKKLVDVSDGVFEVILVKRPKNILELNDLVISISNSSFSSPLISFFKTKECVFEFENEIDWSLDGEEVKGEKRVEVKNKKEAISFLL